MTVARAAPLAVLPVAVLPVALVFAAGGPDQGDANIGAGLVVFGVLVGLSFTWALVDGYRERTALVPLIARWGIVAVVVPVTITVALWALSRTAPDWTGSPEMLVLWMFLAAMSFVPAVVGVALGSAARGASGPAQSKLNSGGRMTTTAAAHRANTGR